jgi:uncharacterized membrane protein YdbT with pleckstrin-like domain
MKYVTKVLQPGESVVYTTRLHWLIFRRAITAFVFGLAFLVASGLSNGNLVTALQILAILCWLLALSAWIRALILRATTEFAVTDRRVIYKTGIFSRHTREMNRSRVESVDVDQAIFGRIFGYGTVIVKGTGGTFEPIYFVAEPLTFRSHITAG